MLFGAALPRALYPCSGPGAVRDSAEQDSVRVRDFGPQCQASSLLHIHLEEALGHQRLQSMGTPTPLPSRTPEQPLGLPGRVSEQDALQGLPGPGDTSCPAPQSNNPPLVGWEMDLAWDTAGGWASPTPTSSAGSPPPIPCPPCPAPAKWGQAVPPWGLAWQVAVVFELCVGRSEQVQMKLECGKKSLHTPCCLKAHHTPWWAPRCVDLGGVGQPSSV